MALFVGPSGLDVHRDGRTRNPGVTLRGPARGRGDGSTAGTVPHGGAGRTPVPDHPSTSLRGTNDRWPIDPSPPRTAAEHVARCAFATDLERPRGSKTHRPPDPAGRPSGARPLVPGGGRGFLVLLHLRCEATGWAPIVLAWSTVPCGGTRPDPSSTSATPGDSAGAVPVLQDGLR